MTSLARNVGLGMSAGAVAVIMIVAFMWVGPGVAVFFDTASASVLFDEQKVVDIYDRVSPVVVEVNISRGTGRNLVPSGAGSGFLIDREGHIVTNNHVVASVVDSVGSVRVTFSNGTTANATILGRNPANDMALLKVDASLVEGVEPLVLGDSSSLRPGQMAIAIGNPFGLEGSITVGVISQVGRNLPSSLGRPISEVIQTDALINPGNSGGPLLDSSGAVVGINTAIQVSPTNGVSRGIGFAVPIATLKDLLPRLKQGGIVRPPRLGVQAQDINAQLAQRLALPVDSGVYVVGVAPDSPAETAGLIEAGLGSGGTPAVGGDIITAVDGVAVGSTAELITRLNTKQPGDDVTLTVMRRGQTIEVVVILDAWPDEREVVERRRFERRPQPDDRDSFPRDFFRRFFPEPEDHGDGDFSEDPVDRLIPYPFHR